MDAPVTATDARRLFSRLLRNVREGSSYVVTCHGKPVARIVPVGPDRTALAAHAALFTRLRTQPAVEAGGWTRDALYEKEQ